METRVLQCMCGVWGRLSRVGSLLRPCGAWGSNSSSQTWWQATELPPWTLVRLTILWHSLLGLGMDDPFTFCPLDSGRVIVAHRCLIFQRPSHHKASCWSFSRLPGWEDLSACFPVCSPALSQYKFHQWGGLGGKALGAQVWWLQFHLWNPRKGGSGESAPQSCPLASPPTHTVIINTLL